MSLAMSISLRDTASPILQSLLANIRANQAHGLKAAAGAAASGVIQGHLRTLDADRPNVLGGKRTHYYNGAARGTDYDVSDDGVLVTVHHTGIALHYYGGVVRPINVKALTIPAAPEAHGRRAAEFTNLELVWPKGSNRGWLYMPEYRETKIRKTKKGPKVVQGPLKGGKIYFWLVAKATIKADPTILPDSALITDAVTLAMLAHITRSAKRGSLQ